MATIVIPAHKEASVIGRTLGSLADGGLRPGTRVVVACNGCTDDTVSIAQGFSNRLTLDVINVDVTSKQAALNGADEYLAGLLPEQGFPRVYLDADIVAPAASVTAVLDVLDQGKVLAARPPLHYLTEQADAGVKAYYRARSRTPEVLQALWGAGIYAVSAEGRKRWDEFPLNAPDDLFVDSRFAADEKCIVEAAPVRIEVPRTTKALLKTLKRVYRPSEEVVDQAADAPAPAGGTLKALLRNNSHGPAQWADAAGYVALSMGARAGIKLDERRGHSGADWERDETTR